MMFSFLGGIFKGMGILLFSLERRESLYIDYVMFKVAQEINMLLRLMERFIG